VNASVISEIASVTRRIVSACGTSRSITPRPHRSGRGPAKQDPPPERHQVQRDPDEQQLLQHLVPRREREHSTTSPTVIAAPDPRQHPRDEAETPPAGSPRDRDAERVLGRSILATNSSSPRCREDHRRRDLHPQDRRRAWLRPLQERRPRPERVSQPPRSRQLSVATTPSDARTAISTVSDEQNPPDRVRLLVLRQRTTARAPTRTQAQSIRARTDKGGALAHVALIGAAGGGGGEGHRVSHHRATPEGEPSHQGAALPHDIPHTQPNRRSQRTPSGTATLRSRTRPLSPSPFPLYPSHSSPSAPHSSSSIHHHVHPPPRPAPLASR
jgi:hypothetical protein